MTDIKVPTLGESVSEATVNRWLKAKGDTVQRDEALVELETDKVTVEIPSPEAGTLSEIIAGEGKNVAVGDVIATITPGGGAAEKGGGAADKAPAAKEAAAPAAKEAPAAPAAKEAPAAKPESAPAAKEAPAPAPAGVKAGPATRREAEQKGIDISKATPSAAHNITTKEDLANVSAAPAAAPVPASAPAEGDVRVRMSRLRKKVGERLKAAQNTAAILTTFNEINMQRVMDLRARHQESFQKAYGTKLGFMSFFIKASAVALKNWPAVNAEIDGEEIVYHNRYDIGIAVGAPMGLVVPTLRNADRKTFSELESDVADFGKRAREGKLTLDELSGGTFSITNGGIFGSLMSTPILNPPQSAILGLHKIQMRPIAVDGKVEIAPMMNVALSYDHRLIDGREAVSFLVDIKNYIEDPSKLLLG